MHDPVRKPISASRRSIRLILSINFLLFGLLIVPPAHRWADRRLLPLRAAGLEELVAWSVQLWLVGSTVLATALFGRMVWGKKGEASAGAGTLPLRVEGILLLTWWIVVICACAYGFALGMGG